MVEFFARRPIFASVVALIVLIAGTLAGLALPIAQFPNIVPPTVNVTAAYPGANASVVEQSIAAPIEQQVNGTQGALYMSSKSANDGTYNLTVTFDVGTDQDLAAIDIQNRVSVATSALPTDVTRNGVVVAKRSTSFLMVVSLTSPDRSRDPVFLSNYATLNVVDTLARIPGVASATVFGARDFAMRIWLDPQRMARLGVTARDVVAAVQEQNVVAPAGSIGDPPALPGQQLQYTATVRGRLVDAQEFGQVIVRAAGSGGGVVRVRDVARVELAAASYGQSAQANGEPAAFVGVFLLPSANALTVQSQVRASMDGLAARFPAGVSYSVPYDTTPFVRASLREVTKTCSKPPC